MCILDFLRRVFGSHKACQKAEQQFNYDNLLNSMFNAEQIYKALAKKCHPDLYPESLKDEANQLFQELQKLKHDIEGMNKLQPCVDNLYNKRKAI